MKGAINTIISILYDRMRKLEIGGRIIVCVQSYPISINHRPG